MSHDEKDDPLLLENGVSCRPSNHKIIVSLRLMAKGGGQRPLGGAEEGSQFPPQGVRL